MLLECGKKQTLRACALGGRAALRAAAKQPARRQPAMAAHRPPVPRAAPAPCCPTPSLAPATHLDHRLHVGAQPPQECNHVKGWVAGADLAQRPRLLPLRLQAVHGVLRVGAGWGWRGGGGVCMRACGVCATVQLRRWRGREAEGSRRAGGWG